MHQDHCFVQVVETEVAKQRAQLQHEYHCQMHKQIVHEKEVIEAAELAKKAVADSARQDFNTQKHEASKIKVQVHRQRLASHAAAEQQAALERSKVAELQRQPERLQNAIRVRFRDEMTSKKKENVKTQLQWQKDEAYAREQRLDRIRAMVRHTIINCYGKHAAASSMADLILVTRLGNMRAFPGEGECCSRQIPAIEANQVHAGGGIPPAFSVC